jgi:hypothetical protein
MGVNFDMDGGGHHHRPKCGVITAAKISGDRIEVSGYIYASDFPEIIERLEASAEDYGMSYEVYDGRVEDIRANVWVLDRMTFTGAAILAKDKAAYGSTSIVLEKGE